MTPERFFFIYAFPCAGTLVESKIISQKKYSHLEKLFLSNKTPDKEELESIFKQAFLRIKNLAERMNKKYWDIDVLKEYWYNEHNRLIDSGDGNYKVLPEIFKGLCKVNKASVVEKVLKGSYELLVVRYDNKERTVFCQIISKIEVGDIVTIHHSHAIEKLN